MAEHVCGCGEHGAWWGCGCGDMHTLSLGEATRVRRLTTGLRLLTGQMREADPYTLEWLLEREALLAEELEPQVTKMGSDLIDEIMKELSELKALDGELTPREIKGIANDTEAMLLKASEMFSTGLAPTVGEHAARVYENVRTIKGTIGVDFSLVDKKAIAWMKKDPAVWVKKHFADDVTARVKTISAHALKEGWGRVELASVMEAALQNQVAGYGYWEVLAAANLNRSRTWSAYESMVEQGVAKSTWLSAGDERQCPVCADLDGTVFSVATAVDQHRAIVDADPSPEEYIDLNPWVGTGVRENADGEKETWFYTTDSAKVKHDVTAQFNALTPGKADDGRAIQELGISCPGHAACRCSVEPVD